MDVNQKRLKSLTDATDSAFEQYKQHPASADYANAYEVAKLALDQYMSEIRQSMLEKSKRF